MGRNRGLTTPQGICSSRRRGIWRHAVDAIGEALRLDPSPCAVMPSPSQRNAGYGGDSAPPDAIIFGPLSADCAQKLLNQPLAEKWFRRCDSLV